MNVKISSSKIPVIIVGFKVNFTLRIFEKKKKNVKHKKFHQNPSSGSPVVSCGWTYMTKIIVAFRNFANAPTNMKLVKR
jgi:hypothetical protein